MQTQWMTSMEVFAPLVLPVLDAIKPKLIGEIGVADGGNTRLLYEFQKANKGKLITIDPFARDPFLTWVKNCRDVVTHFADFSLNCISKTSHVDVWFVNGDHNWYTVFNELTLINKLAKEHAPAIIFIHDVSWPCGRRDKYTDPSQIPADFLQPSSNEVGVTFDRLASTNGVLKGPYWALREGGPRNGVLTAVEDFLDATHSQYQWLHIPAILGLGILVDKAHRLASTIIEFYMPYNNNPIMEMLERDRISQYITAVKLNEKLKKIIATADELT